MAPKSAAAQGPLDWAKGFNKEHDMEKMIAFLNRMEGPRLFCVQLFWCMFFLTLSPSLVPALELLDRPKLNNPAAKKLMSFVEGVRTMPGAMGFMRMPVSTRS